MTDWDQRELCPDGACVGVIGPAGTCKTCGRAATNWGDERNRGLTPLPPGDVETAPVDDEILDKSSDEYEYDDNEDDDDDAADDAPAAEWTERKLCPDDACIGVLGADDRCKVCGKSP